MKKIITVILMTASLFLASCGSQTAGSSDSHYGQTPVANIEWVEVPSPVNTYSTFCWSRTIDPISTSEGYGYAGCVAIPLSDLPAVLDEPNRTDYWCPALPRFFDIEGNPIYYSAEELDALAAVCDESEPLAATSSSGHPWCAEVGPPPLFDSKGNFISYSEEEWMTYFANCD